MPPSVYTEIAVGGSSGVGFDLEVIAEDVRAAPRLFVISTNPDIDIYAAAWGGCGSITIIFTSSVQMQ